MSKNKKLKTSFARSGPVPDYATPEEISQRIERAKKTVKEISKGEKPLSLTFRINSKK